MGVWFVVLVDLGVVNLDVVVHVGVDIFGVVDIVGVAIFCCYCGFFFSLRGMTASEEEVPSSGTALEAGISGSQHVPSFLGVFKRK